MVDDILSTAPLGEILLDFEQFERPVGKDCGLFVRKNIESWDVDTVAVLACADIDDRIELKFQASLEFVADVSLIRRIIEHARYHKPNCTPNDLFDALHYYLETNSYMRFDYY